MQTALFHCKGDLTTFPAAVHFSCIVDSFKLPFFPFPRQRTPLPREYGRELDDIVSKMLEINAEDRWSATDILDTPLLQSYEEKRVSQ